VPRPLVARAPDVPTAAVEATTIRVAAAGTARTPVETRVLGLSITASEPGTVGAVAPASLARTGVSAWLVHLAWVGMALILGGLALVWVFDRMGAHDAVVRVTRR
jgi:hypothetical protein